MKKEVLVKLIDFSEEIMRKNYDNRDKLAVVSLLIRGISPFNNSEILSAEVDVSEWNRLLKQLEIV